jgi:hypothetical protein
MLNASADPHKRAATNCAANAIIQAKARGFKLLERELAASCEWDAAMPHSKGPEDRSPGPMCL